MTTAYFSIGGGFVQEITGIELKICQPLPDLTGIEQTFTRLSHTLYQIPIPFSAQIDSWNPNCPMSSFAILTETEQPTSTLWDLLNDIRSIEAKGVV
jgi:hypothetical protein